MTTPMTGFELPRTYVLITNRKTNQHLTISKGKGATDTAMPLPLGDNMIRIASPLLRGKIRVVGTRLGSQSVFQDWIEIPRAGLMVSIPCVDPNATFSVEADTNQYVDISVTVFNIPPAK